MGSIRTDLILKMKKLLLCALALTSLAGSMFAADYKVELSEKNVGYWWYNKSQWSGGKDESKDWLYSNSEKLVEVKNQYDYYGGSDRYFEQRDAYIQIDLSSLSGIDVSTISKITFNFCIKELNDATSSPARLKHLDVQSIAPTGDAAQKLGGSTEVANSATMIVGWNSIDVGSSIISDLENGYDYAVFSFEKFGSEMDHSRLLTFYSPSSSELVDGVSVVPYLSVTTTNVPEPATYAAVFGALALALAAYRRRK